MPTRVKISELCQRPLYNPDPSTLVLPRLLETTELRQARLSDYVVGALKFAQASKFIVGKQGDLFETVFTTRNKSMSIRVARSHEGHPFRAPDGSIMKVGDLVMKGDMEEGPGPWDLENVKGCEGYVEWRAEILRKRLPEDLKALENTPFPPAECLLEAIEYPPRKAKRTRVTKTEDVNDKVAGNGMGLMEQQGEQEQANPSYGRSLSGYEQDIENILSQGSGHVLQPIECAQQGRGIEGSNHRQQPVAQNSVIFVELQGNQGREQVHGTGLLQHMQPRSRTPLPSSSHIVDPERPVKKRKTNTNTTAKPNTVEKLTAIPNPKPIEQPKAISQPNKPVWMTETDEDWMTDNNIDFVKQLEEGHYDDPNENGYLVRMRPLRDLQVKEMRDHIKSLGKAAEKGKGEGEWKGGALRSGKGKGIGGGDGWDR